MDLASALKRLADYHTKNTRASRQIFESGVIVFRNDPLHKLGDDCRYPQNKTLLRGRNAQG
jgi:ER membrane protein complex subunit 2